MVQRTKAEYLDRYQKNRCWFCGQRMFNDVTREHVLARSRGGEDTRENLRAAHSLCNSAAGSLSVRDKMALRAVASATPNGPRELEKMARELRRAEARAAFEGDEYEETEDIPLSSVPKKPPKLKWDTPPIE